LESVYGERPSSSVPHVGMVGFTCGCKKKKERKKEEETERKRKRKGGRKGGREGGEKGKGGSKRKGHHNNVFQAKLMPFSNERERQTYICTYTRTYTYSRGDKHTYVHTQARIHTAVGMVGFTCSCVTHTRIRTHAHIHTPIGMVGFTCGCRCFGDHRSKKCKRYSWETILSKIAQKNSSGRKGEYGEERVVGQRIRRKV